MGDEKDRGSGGRGSEKMRREEKDLPLSISLAFAPLTAHLHESGKAKENGMQGRE